MLLVGLEPPISASDRPQTYALDLTAIGTSIKSILEYLIFFKTKNMLSNLGYCGMQTALKYLGQRITKNIKKFNTAHHKEYFVKDRIV
jgi:hypothetical protein